MSERIPNQEKKENVETALENNHEAVKAACVDALLRRHSAKLFHAPSHTIGRPEAKTLEGVANVAVELVTTLKRTMPRSLQLENESRAVEFSTFAYGIEDGMLGHDVVMEINGISDNGMVQRRRGFVEGGNEFESARFVLDASTLEDEAVLEKYKMVVWNSIAGTDPNEMDFNKPLDDTAFPSGLSTELKDLLTDAEAGLRYAHIGSSYTADSLEGLLASTADLSAAVVPERFFATGNEEFWELNVGISRACVDFMSSPKVFQKVRAIEVLTAMESWRKTQVKVALGQYIRLKENFSVKNVTALFERSFGWKPEAEEVSEFCTEVQKMGFGMQESITKSFLRYQEFKEISQVLTDSEAEYLSGDERIKFLQAIQFMQGNQDRLEDYLAHVEAELEKSV